MVVVKFPSKLAVIIQSSISLILLRDLKAIGLSCMSAPPIIAQIEFFQAKADRDEGPAFLSVYKCAKLFYKKGLHLHIILKHTH